MGATAAELGIIVDTSTVKAAVKDLQDLSASGKATSADVTKASKGVVTAFAGLAGEARKAGDETFKLASKFTPAIAAAAKMEKEFEDLQKALDTNAITLAQYQQHLDAMATRATRALGLTSTATDKVVAANEKAAAATERVAAAATRAVPSVQKMTQGTAAVAKASGQGQMAMRNFAYQLNQVGQQGAVTGNYLQALSIQIPDIMAGFGSLPAVLLGGAIAVASSLLPALLSAGDAGEDLTDKLDALAEAMSHLRSVQGDINGDFSDLTREFGINAAAAKELLEIQRQLAEVRATRAFDKAAGGISSALSGESFTNVDAVQAGIAALDELKAREQEVLDKMASIQGAGMGGAILPVTELGESLFALQGQLDAVKQEMAGYSQFDAVLSKLTGEFGLSAEAARQLVLAATEVNGALTVEDRVDAMQRLAQTLDDVTAGFAVGNDEAYTLYQQLLDAVTAGLQLEGMDYASSISAGADQASRLADEMQRAVNNAISLAAQGISNLRQSELRLQYRNDPVGLAGAMAREEFGDVSGFDPILRGELEKQRDAFIANAEATEANKQALIEWQKAQAQAASGSGRRGGGGGSRGGASEAAKELQQLMREGESITKSVMTAQEEYSAAIAQAARLLDVGAISQETYNRHVAQLGVELQEAQFGDLIGQIEDVSDALAQAIVNGDSLGDTFASLFKRMAAEYLSNGISNILKGVMGAGGTSNGTQQGGLFSLFTGGSLLSFDGGGYTGKSSRSGGLDGKGGFMAMLHPQETVIDHSKGQSAGGGSVDVNVSVSVDDDGKIAALVRQSEARQAKALPDAVRKINANPRRK